MQAPTPYNMTNSTIFLNDSFQASCDAVLPAKDRSIIFGDSIYEVIPEDNEQLIAFDLHIDRLNRNLREVGINLDMSRSRWREICEELIQRNGRRPIYLQVSRGVMAERLLGFTNDIKPTVLAFSLDKSDQLLPVHAQTEGYAVCCLPDIRWDRCDIKSTSLIASAMLFDKATANGYDEAILYNKQNQITEGCAVNIFIVKDDVISTPPLDHQILPGITRHILLSALRETSSMVVQERRIQRSEIFSADEVLLSSSTKGIGPIVKVDEQIIGTGKPGDYWAELLKIYELNKLNH